MTDVHVAGDAGAPGATYGASGKAGQNANAVNIGSLDPENIATAVGGAGGHGQNGRPRDDANKFSPGPGGNGASGGSANATVMTAAAFAGLALAKATATGGSGGSAGLPGAEDVARSLNGNAGDASAAATSTNTIGDATAMATAYGGQAGGEGTGGVSGSVTGHSLAVAGSDAIATAKTTVYAGHSGGGVGGNGAGGIVVDATATAHGGIEASASVDARAGLGFGNRIGASGDGAAVCLNNAVSGTTQGGYLSLDQSVTGGQGGSGPHPGNGGNATSLLTFVDTTSSSVNAISQAYAGAGGGTHNDGTGDGGVGGDAVASVDATATKSLLASAYAQGGDGGSVVFALGAAAPGKGGNATASAIGTVTSETGDVAARSKFVFGGAGGSLYGEASGSAMGGAGGDVTGSGAKAYGVAGNVTAEGDMVAGPGGAAHGTGRTAGPGGTVSESTVMAIASGAGTATARFRLVGGAGGSGYYGANGADGTSLGAMNLVSGSTVGGSLALIQEVVGGTGGHATSRSAGDGGAGTSTLNITDSTSTTLYVEAASFGGAGGSGIPGHGFFDDGPGSAGAGGVATSSVQATGAGVVAVDSNATGGGAGSAGEGGTFADGGSAAAHAAATATGSTGSASAIAVARGGMADFNSASSTNGGSAVASALADGTAILTVDSTHGYAASASATAHAGRGPLGWASAEAKATALAANGLGAIATAGIDGGSGSATATARSSTALMPSISATTTIPALPANHSEGAIATSIVTPNALFAPFVSSYRAVAQAGSGLNYTADYGSNNTPFLTADATVIIGYGAISATYDTPTSGPELEEVTTSTLAWSINTADQPAWGTIGLAFVQQSHASPDFSALTLTVSLQGVQVLAESFASVEQADAFLTNHFVDLGTYAAPAGLLDVSVTLSQTLAATGAGYGVVFGLGIDNSVPHLAIEAASGEPAGTAAEGDSGSTAYSFTVTRSGRTNGATTVDWAVKGSGASPASGSDFVGGGLPSGTIAFAEGETSTTITVLVAGDSLVEGDEDFSIALANPTGAAVIDTASAAATIVNDDTSIAITAMDSPQDEGNETLTTYSFEATRTGDVSAEGKVAWAVTGIAIGSNAAATGDDFAGGTLPSGVITFAAGETSTILAITVAGDLAIEAQETFTVTLSAPSAGASLGTATATGTIVNDDARLSIAALAASKPEGQAGTTALTFTVTRTGDTSTAHTAGYAVSGSGPNAATAADFADGVLPTGTISFAAGDTSTTITIPIAGDTALEADETFTVTLSDPSAGASLGTATAAGTIRNDDARLSIAPLAASKPEGHAGTTPLTFTVTRAGDTSIAHTAGFTVFGSGTNPANAADFAGGVLPSGTVSFAAGETSKTITIPVAGDNGVEAHETFTVALAGPSAGAAIATGAAIGTIANDDARLSIAALSASKPEGNAGSTALTFTVTRSGSTATAHTAAFTVAGTGANPVNGADFTGGALPTGTVSFAAGETSKTITLSVAADSALEADEGLVVTLSGPSAGATIATATATGTIRNDDAQLSITPLAATKPEGNGGTTALTFTVTRTGNTAVAHSAAYAVSGTGTDPASAADFPGSVFPTGTVSFAAGQTSRTITIPVSGELAFEADEQFAVTLSKASAGASIGTATAIGTIGNDDVPATGTLAIQRVQSSRAEGQAGTTPFTFAVTRSGDTTGPAWASWAVTGGGIANTGAASATDFGGKLPSGAVTFFPGETTKPVTINVSADTVVELNESFTVTLSGAPEGVTLATPSATGAIWNDDTAGTGTLAIARAAGSQKPEGQTGTTAYTFTVTRTGDLTGPASADWAVTGGGVSSTVPATAADFAGGVLPSGRVNFAAGQGLTTVTVNVAADSTIELNDSFTVTLAAPQLGVTIGTPAATGVIVNDDFPPSGVLSIAGLQADRGKGASGGTAFTFVVTRAGSIAGPASATWTAAAGTATEDDFAGGTLPSGSVTFAPGQASQVVTLTVAGDTVAEEDETFTVSLSGVPAGVTLGTATATGTIRNDDPAGTGVLAIARAAARTPEGAAGTTPFTFTVTRSGDLTGIAAADWAVSGGGATGTSPATGADFAGGQFPSGRVSFAAGQAVQTVTVNVAGDTVAELNESFTVALSNAQAGVSVATPSATGVILADDFASTAASQTLTGTDAPDVFLLGGGIDSIVAKAGLDQFRFLPAAIGPASGNTATLQDFSRAAGEVMDLSAIDAIAATLADDAFIFIGTAAFTAAGQLRWQDQGTTRLIQGEVSGDGIADLTIVVKALGPIDSTWFAL